MVSETIELRGHIIDSLILPKVLDQIITDGASFKIVEIRIGEKRVDPSFARIEVSGSSTDGLDDLILRLRQHGAEVVERKSVQLAPAPADGVFPQEFYATTDQQTFVRLEDGEIEVQPALMDSGIVIDRSARTARATRFHGIKKGMEVVVGHQGIRVLPAQRSTSRADVFEFISGNVPIEKPKSVVIREIAREFKRAREDKGRILVVAGAAVVHTGAGEHLEKLIERGYVDLLFAGNGLAAHDIEHALYGTSSGVSLARGGLADKGRENYLRAINAIRGAGGIRQAIDGGLLRGGLMHACVSHGVDFVLAGSIRDDGPLPEVITDSLVAQETMQAKIGGVSIALMMGTMLHSLAVGNLLPATVKKVCLDINPALIDKLAERSAFQAVGLVTDLEPFLRELVGCLEADR